MTAGRHNASLPWAIPIPVLQQLGLQLRPSPPLPPPHQSGLSSLNAAGKGSWLGPLLQRWGSGTLVFTPCGMLCISPLWVPREAQHLLLKAKNRKVEQSLSPWVGYPGLQGHILVSTTSGCSRECQSMKHPCNTQRSLPGTDQDSSVTSPLPLSRSQAPGAFSCPSGAGQTMRLQLCPVQIPVLRGPHPALCAPHSLGDGSSPPRDSSLPLTACAQTPLGGAAAAEQAGSWVLAGTRHSKQAWLRLTEPLAMMKQRPASIPRAVPYKGSWLPREAPSRGVWGTETHQSRFHQLQPELQAQLPQLCPPTPHHCHDPHRAMVYLLSPREATINRPTLPHLSHSIKAQ